MKMQWAVYLVESTRRGCILLSESIHLFRNCGDSIFLLPKHRASFLLPTVHFSFVHFLLLPVPLYDLFVFFNHDPFYDILTMCNRLKLYIVGLLSGAHQLFLFFFFRLSFISQSASRDPSSYLVCKPPPRVLGK